MNRTISISSRILREARTQSGKTLQSLVSRRPTIVFFIDAACPGCRFALKGISKKRHAIAANGANIVFVHRNEDRNAEILLKDHRLGDLPRIKDSTGDLFHAFKYHPRSFGRQYLEDVENSRGLPILGLSSYMRQQHVPCIFLIAENEVRAASTRTPPSIDQLLIDWFPDETTRILSEFSEPSQVPA